MHANTCMVIARDPGTRSFIQPLFRISRVAEGGLKFHSTARELVPSRARVMLMFVCARKSCACGPWHAVASGRRSRVEASDLKTAKYSRLSAEQTSCEHSLSNLTKIASSLGRKWKMLEACHLSHVFPHKFVNGQNLAVRKVVIHLQLVI